MTRTYLRRLSLAAVLVCMGIPSALHAQAGAPAPIEAAPQAEATPDPNAVTEPKLLAFVDAGYPEEARALKLEAEVLLVLTIGTDGFVESAELAGPKVGYGFDELALSAARRFVFEPATRGGEPMRARIRYLYQFRFQELPSPEAPAEVEAQARGELELTLLSAEDQKPLADVEVIVTATFGEQTSLRVVTDAEGKARVTDLAPGVYEVSLSKAKFTTEVHQEQVVEGEVASLTYRLSPEREDQGYGAVARVKAPPREVTRRTIEREELTRVAGTRGDALRTIELLPGVARPPFGAGLVLIRGSAPGDSQVFLNGVQVPLLYHFGGLTSFINSRALDRIDFYPGNFSARYGRVIGGIIDVGARDPASDGYHGVVDVNVPLDSSLLLEGPIGKNASFLVAGRRSYFGEIFKATIPEGTFNQFAAPVYNDYQLFVSYRPTPRDKLRLGVYGSSDRLEVLFAQAPDDDPSVRSVELGLKFHRQQIGWDHRYSNKLDHSMELSFGRTVQGFSIGDGISLDVAVNQIVARAEWRYNVTPWVQLTTGTDTLVGFYDVRYFGPQPTNGNDGGGSIAARPPKAVREEGAQVLPAIFAELALRPIEALRIIPSLRLDYFDGINRFAFDPRLAVVYALNKKTRLKGGVGVFTQPPLPEQSSRTLGNPKLKPTRATHYSLGVDHDFTDDLSLGVEGFYKDVYDRVVATDYQAAAERGDYDPAPYENDGIGRIYGLEVAGRKQAKGRWFGFLSYTLMRSQRKDHGGPWYLFEFDQTHIFAASGTVRLGRKWELGGTLRIVTGNPETPIVGASFDQNTGLYVPEMGRLNSVRAPTFNRLDIRFERKWTFSSWRLAFYLDVQNVYNATNNEGTSYNFNYTERADIRGLITIPILGLRGEL